MRSIDPALLRRYHDNDPALVVDVLLATPLHQRNRLTADWEGAWVLDADPIPGWPGRPVTVRPRGDGCRVELDFETPADAVALAERMLARGHLRAV